jgi:hypothetical protein
MKFPKRQADGPVCGDVALRVVTDQPESLGARVQAVVDCSVDAHESGVATELGARARCRG